MEIKKKYWNEILDDIKLEDMEDVTIKQCHIKKLSLFNCHNCVIETCFIEELSLFGCYRCIISDNMLGSLQLDGASYECTITYNAIIKND